MILEYRTELIRVSPGPAGETNVLLNGWAEDGWRVVSILAVPYETGPRTDPNTRTAVGLFVCLERERVEILASQVEMSRLERSET